MPFSTTESPFHVVVKARQLPAWGYWSDSKDTDNLPPSPVDCTPATGTRNSQCGEEVDVKLTPFGGTNIRISAHPTSPFEF